MGRERKFAFVEYRNAVEDRKVSALERDMGILRRIHDDVDRLTEAIANLPVTDPNFMLTREAIRETWTAFRAVMEDELEPYLTACAEAHNDAAVGVEHDRAKRKRNSNV